MLNPLRRWLESPAALLGPHVRPGMTVLEPGCGMGFFSLELARRVGPTGRLVCVDLQPRMIAGLERRVRRAGLSGRLEAIAGTLDDERLDAHRENVDFAAAIHMVHEVPDPARFLGRLAELARPGGRLLLMEPPHHVSAAAFERTLRVAEAAGWARSGDAAPPKALRAVLVRRDGGAS
jgi:ubiquinone/menaquinone biosynthesis C-methylase UbiE